MSYKVYPGDANTPVILAERLTLTQRQPSPLCAEPNAYSALD